MKKFVQKLTKINTPQTTKESPKKVVEKFSLSNSKEKETLSPTKKMEKPLYSVIANYDFNATEEIELSFKDGEEIFVLETDPSGWWRGRNSTGEEGFFPSNYMKDTQKQINTTCVALYDYEADDDGELTLKEGEILHVISDVDGWYLGTNSKGEKGVFPSNFVELSKTPELKPTEPVTNNPTVTKSTETDTKTTSNVIGVYHTLYDYTATGPNELSLKVGEIIYLLDKSTGGWWRGKNAKSEEGLFPSNFVKNEKEYNPTNQINMDCIALYDFKAADDDKELTLKKGETIHVISDTGGWYFGKNSKGKQGIFPSNYVELLKPGIQPNTNQEIKQKKTPPSSTSYGGVVRDWFSKLNFSPHHQEQYCKIFMENGYDDLDVVMTIEDKDLHSFQIPVGHQKRIMIAIMALKHKETKDIPKRETTRFSDGLLNLTSIKIQFYPASYNPTKTLREVISAFGFLGANCLEWALTQEKDTISVEQLAAIYMYTIESPFYKELNKIMRTQDSTEIVTYRDYIYYFTQALDILASFSGSVYRGIDCKVMGYTVNKTIVWPAFSSATKNPKVAIQFLSGNHGTLFLIECLTAKSISKYSSHKEEDEILFKPNSMFTVTSQMNPTTKKLLQEALNVDLGDVDIFNLKQID